MGLLKHAFRLFCKKTRKPILPMHNDDIFIVPMHTDDIFKFHMLYRNNVPSFNLIVRRSDTKLKTA